MDEKNREKMLALVEGDSDDETPEDVREEAARELSDAVEDYLRDWDDFARERWYDRNVGDYSPDHVVLNPRHMSSDVLDLPEYDDFYKIASAVSKDVLTVLNEVKAVEAKASNVYFMARKRLVEAARRLPGADKRRHPRTFDDEY